MLCFILYYLQQSPVRTGRCDDAYMRTNQIEEKTRRELDVVATYSTKDSRRCIICTCGSFRLPRLQDCSYENDNACADYQTGIPAYSVLGCTENISLAMEEKRISSIKFSPAIVFLDGGTFVNFLLHRDTS